MFNRIEMYFIYNLFLYVELYRIIYVIIIFWWNFMWYIYVLEKFNLNWYNGGIVYNISMKIKKKFEVFLLWDNILFFFGRILDFIYFFNVII